MARLKPITATADGQVAARGQAVEVAAVSFTGLTNVKLLNGGSGGTVLAELTTAGIVHTWSGDTAYFTDGLYVDVTGTGTVVIWVK